MSLTTSMACHSINEIFGPLTREQTKRRIEYRHAIRGKTLKCKVIFAHIKVTMDLSLNNHQHKNRLKINSPFESLCQLR